MRQDVNLKESLRLFPLRIAITDYCNLNCFFCSNEGMPLFQRNKKHADIEQLKYLLTILIDRGLKNISITGGEPTIHPEILELIKFFNIEGPHLNDIFFHTRCSKI